MPNNTIFHDMFKSYKDTEKKIFLKTSKVINKPHKFETVLTHPDYNDGKTLVVNKYDTYSEAVDGHNHWYKLIPDMASLVSGDQTVKHVMPKGPT